MTSVPITDDPVWCKIAMRGMLYANRMLCTARLTDALNAGQDNLGIRAMFEEIYGVRWDSIEDHKGFIRAHAFATEVAG